MTLPTSQQGRKRAWTGAELDLLRAMYPDCHTADVAKWLGRGVGSTYQAAAAHGIRKSAEYLSSAAACRVSVINVNPAHQASRFKAGHKTWNAGMTGWVAPRSERTRFKPGNQPLNQRPMGSTRICDGVLERKEGPKRRDWKPVHRTVWESVNGPTPVGSIVVFKRGMRTTVLEEITADRVECITRAENLRRNHPRSWHPELGRLVQLKGAINRQLNRIAKESHAAHQ